MNADNARHATGHGTSRRSAEIIEGVQRGSRAFKESAGSSKEFEGVRRVGGIFEGVRGRSKSRRDLQRSSRVFEESPGCSKRFAGVRGGWLDEWNGMDAEGGSGVP